MNAIFGLVRGYSGLHKWKYIQLVLRNWHLAIWSRRSNWEGDFLIFHEGNIRKHDQMLIKLLSRLDLKFIDVSHVFRKASHHNWDNTSDFPLSYSLMCKFNYFDVWQYLEKYDYVARVDEDCLVKNLPEFSFESELLTGALFPESHPNTNSTFPKFLKTIGLEKYYDHQFPYTNLYVTKMDFWRKAEVRDYLNQVQRNPESLNLRWGDLPVLGVALKAFGKWNAVESVSKEIVYYHLSHFTKVDDGKKYNFKDREIW